jgi:arylsulfatase A-like enzyme
MDRPSVLFVTADHLRRDVAGRHDVAPNLNALADRGVEFANAYCASPLCMPSRNCIATGQFPSQHGVCGNMNEPLDAGQRADTYMSHLRDAGYRTALVGKHHFIDSYGLGVDVVDEIDDEIAEYGYDHVHQVLDDGENLHNDDRFTRHLDDIGELERYRRLQGEGADCPYGPENVADGYIGEQSLAFVEEHDGDEPFYLHASFVGPHPPYGWVPDAFDTFDPEDAPEPVGVDDPERRRSIRETRANYMGKVALIDHYVGELVDALEAADRLDETLIVVTSDHGDMLGDDEAFDKRHFEEQSVGVPLVLAGPGVETGEVPERQGGGLTRKELVSLVDLYPTFLDAAGLDAPGGPGVHGDDDRSGRSLFPVIDGSAEDRRDAVFSELGTTMMVRDASHKLVYDPERGGPLKLYDLRTDPGERTNRAGDPGAADAQRRLIERLCSRLIRQSNETHEKEQMRVQDVRV